MIKQQEVKKSGHECHDRLLRRAEAAQMLGRGVKTVDRMAARGVLQKVTFPHGKRAAGFRMSDIARLIGRGAE
jgi:predicted DNA-binding transcriptional regulator AlpA